MKVPNTLVSVFAKIVIIIIINFLHGLGLLIVTALTRCHRFLGRPRSLLPLDFVVEGVFRESGVVHSFKMVDPVLFVFGSQVLYSTDL